MHRYVLVTGTLALFTFACTKGENAGGGTGAGSSPSGGTTSSVTPMPLASSAPAPSPPSASAVTVTAGATDASAKVATEASPAKDGGGAAGPKVTSRVTGKNFALDLTSGGCKAGAECVMTIRLQAESGFHINKQYPYKFLANAEPSLTFLGKAAPTTFSRESGDFVEEGEKAGTMTVRFKPSSAGKAKVAGTYKLSVCSDDQCQIEQEKLELLVPVL